MDFVKYEPAFVDSVKFEPACVDSVNSMESRKWKGHNFGYQGLPLPYLIRPRKAMDICDPFDLYNSYAESSCDIDDESDQDELTLDGVETTPLPYFTCPSLELDNGNSFGLENENAEKSPDMDASGDSSSDDNDEEYVMVDKVEESLPNSKPERPRAIQMMELSKDSSVSPLPSNEISQAQSIVVNNNTQANRITVDESNPEEDEDGGSSNYDDWVVV